MRVTNIREVHVAGEDEVRLLSLRNAGFFDAFDFDFDIHRNLLVQVQKCVESPVPPGTSKI
ncbi:hypothetical protein D3C85_1735910 [compost metagenome]